MSGMGNITCVKRVKEDWFDSMIVPAAPELILFRLRTYACSQLLWYKVNTVRDASLPCSLIFHSRIRSLVLASVMQRTH